MSERIYKQINRSLGRAIAQYDMITDGDRIAVGLSGGKDSLTLLYCLNERLARIRIRYLLFPIYIDPGFSDEIAVSLQQYLDKQSISLHVEKTNNGILGHSEENRENPCFLCARLRRKRMFEIADQYSCKTIALGHTKDDIIETLFLNMCYAGEISTMKPLQTLFNGQLKIIRPLAFVEEKTIRRFVEIHNLPILTNPCPSAGVSKRSEIKKMLETLYRTNSKIKGNIFRSMTRVKQDYLL